MDALPSKLLLALVIGVGLAACDSLGNLRSAYAPPSQSAAEMLNGTLIGIAVPRNDESAYQARPKGGYPVATPTDRKGLVVSPYAPYYEIDVRGIAHHNLVRDPSCGRLFVLP